MSCSTAVGRWWLVFGGSQEKGALVEDEERAGSDLAMGVCWQLGSLLANEAGRAGSEFLEDGGDRRRVSCERERGRARYAPRVSCVVACLNLTGA